MAIQFLNTVQVDTDVLYVDASTNKVGIGTTSPSTDLEVSSTGVNGVDISQSASNASQSGRLFFTTNTASEGFALFNSNGTFQVNSGGIPNNTSGTNRISIIGSSGNVGIGTTSPSTKLHVSGGDIRIDDTEQLQFGAGGVRINNDAAGRMYYRAPLGFYWETNGGYRMVLNSSGFVGVGTTSPTCELQVGNYGSAETPEIRVGGGTSSQIQLNTSNATGSFAQVGFGGSQFASSNTAGKVKYTHTSQTSPQFDVMSFRVNYSDRMVIDGLGNVGIGTTSPGGKLEINGGTGVATTGGTFIVRQDGDAATDGIAITSSNAASHRIWKDANGKLNIGSSSLPSSLVQDLSGNVGIGTTSPGEKLEVDGNVKADNYINQRVAWNVGFLANSVSTSSYYYIPVGYISETTSNQYYNNWVASYAGRVRKIVMRNLGLGSTPTATTINFRITVNGTVTYTGGNATITGSGLNQIATHEFNPGSSGSPFFNATDRVQVAYRTNGLWQYAATSISLEYTE